MSLPLVELPFEEWETLRDLYTERRQEPCSYGLIQNYLKWKLKEPKICARILTLGDCWRSSGTFMLIDADMEPPNIYFNTLDENTQQLLQILNQMNFKTNYFLNTLAGRHLPEIQQYLMQNSTILNEVKFFAGNWYRLSRERALKFDIKPPKDIMLSSLKLQHADEINAAWPHKGPATIKYVQKLIHLNENVGAFDSNKKLIAWCLRTPLGALGNVQVLETHRRLGLGSLLVRYMSKMLALKNEEIMAPVKYDNLASRTMFEKSGFEPVDAAFCMEIPAALNTHA